MVRVIPGMSMSIQRAPLGVVRDHPAACVGEGEEPILEPFGFHRRASWVGSTSDPLRH